MALADDTSPVFVARAMNALGSMFMDVEKLKAAFTGDGAIAWGDHHPCLFKGTEWFFRTGYRAYSRASGSRPWTASRTSSARGAGRGRRLRARRLGGRDGPRVPGRAFLGVRLPCPVDRDGAHRAREAGVRTAPLRGRRPKEYPGAYDLICFFDCLHDMGDPVGIAAYARSTSSGTARCCWSSRSPSTAVARTSGQPDGGRFCHGVDGGMHPQLAVAGGRARARRPSRRGTAEGVFEEAGFSRFRRAAETPLNLILEARP